MFQKERCKSSLFFLSLDKDGKDEQKILRLIFFQKTVKISLPVIIAHIVQLQSDLTICISAFYFVFYSQKLSKYLSFNFRFF